MLALKLYNLIHDAERHLTCCRHALGTNYRHSGEHWRKRALSWYIGSMSPTATPCSLITAMFSKVCFLTRYPQAQIMVKTHGANHDNINKHRA